MFLEIADGGYIININAIAEVAIMAVDEWEVTLVNGSEYTIDGDDLTRLQKILTRITAS